MSALTEILLRVWLVVKLVPVLIGVLLVACILFVAWRSYRDAR